tara:strand:+ start:414 stop:527 length:114 start_codon:yes stop_codon:yes gene_type:complete
MMRAGELVFDIPKEWDEQRRENRRFESLVPNNVDDSF